MTTVQYIDASRAGHLTQARVLEILSDHLSSEIDSELGRGTDDKIAPSDGDYDKLYLPDPDRYIEQPSPSTQQAKEVERVAVFSGQTTEATHQPKGVVEDGGHVTATTVPWAVSFVFAPAPHDVDHPVLSRKLSTEERVESRAQQYRDMIAHTLDKYGMLGSGANNRDHAIEALNVNQSFAASMRLRYGEGSHTLRGTGYVSMTIEQTRRWPQKTQT